MDTREILKYLCYKKILFIENLERKSLFRFRYFNYIHKNWNLWSIVLVTFIFNNLFHKKKTLLLA